MQQRLYEKLIAWQESFHLCLWTYNITKTFPRHEQFGLTSQMRRSASSIPVNIAEGNIKRSAKDKAHFLEIALGSLEELHCQCKIAHGLLYFSTEVFEQADTRMHRVGYLIYKLRQAVLKTPVHSLYSLNSLNSLTSSP